MARGGGAGRGFVRVGNAGWWHSSCWRVRHDSQLHVASKSFRGAPPPARSVDHVARVHDVSLRGGMARRGDQFAQRDVGADVALTRAATRTRRARRDPRGSVYNRAMRFLSVLVLFVAACGGEDVLVGDECSQNDRCQAAGLACEISVSGGYCTARRMSGRGGVRRDRQRHRRLHQGLRGRRGLSRRSGVRRRPGHEPQGLQADVSVAVSGRRRAGAGGRARRCCASARRSCRRGTARWWSASR